MISFDWVKLLTDYGDPVEKMGVTLGLGQTFSRYAEFWAKYVFPNRDEHDPSKLRRNLEPKLEDIFNNHYSVYYQLGKALL